MASTKKTASKPAAKAPASTPKRSPAPATKKAMIDALAASTGESKKSIDKVLHAFGAYALSEVQGRGAVIVPGIGKIRKAVRPARPERTGRDPRTQQSRTFPAIPAKSVARFRFAKAFKTGVESV